MSLLLSLRLLITKADNLTMKLTFSISLRLITYILIICQIGIAANSYTLHIINSNDIYTETNNAFESQLIFEDLEKENKDQISIYSSNYEKIHSNHQALSNYFNLSFDSHKGDIYTPPPELLT